MLEAGTILSNQNGSSWKIGQKIGSGICCQVFEGLDIIYNSQVAVKVYNKGLKFNCAHQREFLLLKIVKERCGEVSQLVEVKGSCNYANQHVLVEEFLQPSLPNIIYTAKQQSHVSLFIINKILQHVTRALNALHMCGFVHADLKPDNILWSAQTGCFKLIDFGLSFNIQDREVGLVQSLSYRAPEVDSPACTGTSLCTAIDMWSLGVLILHLITDKKFVTYRQFTGMCGACQRNEEPCENKEIVLKLLHLTTWHQEKVLLQVLQNIIIQCLQCKATKRPTSYKVLQEIQILPPLNAGFLDLLLLPTCVICLLNMIVNPHLETEEEIKSIKDDIVEECSKLGKVLECTIPMEGPGLNKVYVKYLSNNDAASAFANLNGRSFNGRTVITNYFLPDDYKDKKYF